MRYIGGNDTFRRLVADCKMEYIQEGLPRRQKIAIKKQVIQQIFNEGLVFMERRGDLWYRVTCSSRIDKKVSQALREKAPQIKAKIIQDEVCWSIDAPIKTTSSTEDAFPRESSISVVSFDETTPSTLDPGESDCSHCSDESSTDDEESNPTWAFDGIEDLDWTSPSMWYDDLPLASLTSEVFSA